MWKNEIIDYLRGNSPFFPKEEKHKAFFNQISYWVEYAQTFFFGDFEKIENIYKTNEGRVFNAHFDNPYEYTLFEWTEKNNEYIKPHRKTEPKKAVLLVGNRSKGSQYMIGFTYAKIIAVKCNTAEEIWTWCISPIIPIIEEGNENISWYTWGDSAPLENDEIESKIHDEVNIDLATSRLYLDVLNCQNIVTKDVIPPEKLNRKRIRNGKLPLYTYKILEVVKGKPKSKNAGSVPWDYQSPASVRFHLCRGHFKTFTPDKPLFGKYSGTFWWNPQSRGNKELGEIEKDYDVKVV